MRKTRVISLLAAAYIPLYYVILEGHGRYDLVSRSCSAVIAGVLLGIAGSQLRLQPIWAYVVPPLISYGATTIVNIVVFGGFNTWLYEVYCRSWEGGAPKSVAFWAYSQGFIIATVASGLVGLLGQIVARRRR